MRILCKLFWVKCYGYFIAFSYKLYRGFNYREHWNCVNFTFNFLTLTQVICTLPNADATTLFLHLQKAYLIAVVHVFLSKAIATIFTKCKVRRTWDGKEYWFAERCGRSCKLMSSSHSSQQFLEISQLTD